MNYSVNWFKYRLPNSTAVISGASKSIIEGLGKGFVVAPFLYPQIGSFTIPSDFVPDKADLLPVSSSLPHTTSQEDYFYEIDAIKSDLDGKRGKTVAARVISLDSKIDISATFDSLCDSYPDAFVFAFSSSISGTWIGATPELLLRKEGCKVYTMALAGTRSAFHETSNIEWDVKNIDEQEMVAEFICKCLGETCNKVNREPSYTKKAGKMEHICTPISAVLPSKGESPINNILTKLSPTPAVCGSDRTRSLQIIGEFEHFNREYYGGFCGPNELYGTTAFYVILRAAKCSDNGISIFAGGGITPLSNPYDEWIETELKSKTIINQLKTSEE